MLQVQDTYQLAIANNFRVYTNKNHHFSNHIKELWPVISKHEACMLLYIMINEKPASEDIVNWSLPIYLAFYLLYNEIPNTIANTGKNHFIIYN